MKIYQIVDIGILDTFKNFQERFKSKSLSLLHFNFCLLSKNVDDFSISRREINMNFNIALNVSRIKNNSVSQMNIELENYSIELKTTEIGNRGALLYINKRLSYRLRNI